MHRKREEESCENASEIACGFQKGHKIQQVTAKCGTFPSPGFLQDSIKTMLFERGQDSLTNDCQSRLLKHMHERNFVHLSV
jgi:hypothetical protein